MDALEHLQREKQQSQDFSTQLESWPSNPRLAMTALKEFLISCIHRAIFEN